MSGVVLTLNEGEDDEDVTGLLDDEDEHGDYHMGPGGKGTSKRWGRKRRPFTVVRTSTVGNLMNTLLMCFVFFGLGFTKSCLDRKTFQAQDPLNTEMTSAIGYLTGFVIGGFLLKMFNRFFLIFLALVSLGTALMFVPWVQSVWAVDLTHTLIGIALAILMTAGNVICLEFWGRKSNPYMTTLHFCLSIGLLMGPVLVGPVSNAKLPTIIKDHLPKSATATANVSVIPRDPRFHSRIKRSMLDPIETTTLDPVLAEVFGAVTDKPIEQTTETSTVSFTAKSLPIKPPKHKPVITDGRKLDNTRDWEAVKVAQPPKEELQPQEGLSELEEVLNGFNQTLEDDITTDQPDNATTNTEGSEIKDDIQTEVEAIHEDIKKSDELLEMLKAPLTRRKRSKRSLRSRGRGGTGGGIFDQPDLYNSIQVRPPPLPRYPEEGTWPRIPMARNDIVDYDYRTLNLDDSPYGRDPYQRKDATSFRNEEFSKKEPPKQVAKAIDTVLSYMSGKYEENGTTTEKATSTVRTTTTTPSPTTITTPLSTTRMEATTALPGRTKKPRGHHHKKPTSSFDTDSVRPEAGITISGVLENYGVAQQNVGFFLDAIYIFFLAFLFLFCICYNPREPKARQDDSGEERSKESCIFRYSFAVLLFLFNFLHWGMFVTLMHVIPSFAKHDSSPSNLQSLVVGALTGTRFISMFSCSFLSPTYTLFGSLVVALSGSFLLIFTQQLPALPAWAGILLQTVGLANLLPASLAWSEAYISMTSQAVAFICSGLALGELLVPQMFTQLTNEAQTWLGFAMVGGSTLTLGLFVCVFLMARKHGSKFSRPQTSGYELANQVELNQDLLDDDEDDFEIAEPTLRLNTSDETEA